MSLSIRAPSAAVSKSSTAAASRCSNRIASVSPAPFRGASLKNARTSAVSGMGLRYLAESVGFLAPIRSASSDPFLVTAAAAPEEKMTVAVTGATGLVGSRLVAKLSAQGHSVRVLTRNVAGAKAKLPYRGLSFASPADWGSAISGATHVVNLAGEPIATRWSSELKKQIKSSRINVTRDVTRYINACPEGERPVLVSASAVGFYGVSETQTFNEESQSGNDYLAEVCIAWEAEAMAAKTRTVILRIGVVLAPEGGALAKMLPVFSMFAGGPLGSGQQWFSWIHRDDLVELILKSLKDETMQGAYNATAPKPVRMSEMCSALGSIMGRPSWLPVPEFALKTLLGEGAGVVLDGQKVLPSRAQQAGFEFKYKEVGSAIQNLMVR